MNVLVINCGSSSLKYQLINSDSEIVLAKGLCERIGIDGSAITHQREGEGKVKTEVVMKTSRSIPSLLSVRIILTPALRKDCSLILVRRIS